MCKANRAPKHMYWARSLKASELPAEPFTCADKRNSTSSNAYECVYDFLLTCQEHENKSKFTR